MEIPSTAIVTPSYKPDLDRCETLCASIDKNVTGNFHHYLLVKSGDVSLFRRLTGARRTVIDERDLLPKWLIPSFLRLRDRDIWLSLRGRPLVGWHIQQMLKIAFGAKAAEDAILFCDSDVAFVRPYDPASAFAGGRLRLYREHEGLAKRRGPDHEAWVAHAAKILGAPRDSFNGHDYVGTLISWRPEQVRNMCARIENVAGRSWQRALASSWNISEYMCYGHFVDDVSGGAGHFEDRTDLCQMHWSNRVPEADEIRGWMERLPPEKVAVGLQSHVMFPPHAFRALIGL